MSPLPERSAQPPKHPPANSGLSESASSHENSSSPEAQPTLKRPVMRPPEKPASPPAEVKKAVASSGAAKPSSPAAVTEPSSVAASSETVDDQPISRQQPIPPPSEPKQFRAIGLVRGRYTPSEDKFTQGEMLTTDGTVVEAVLLGRVMSLVRNHLDLEAEHLWVVYPRTREKTEEEPEAKLHVQIVGVWEPETLAKKDEDEPSEAEEEQSPGYEDDYFSVRGEVVAYSADAGVVIVKIQQTPRKANERGKFFKLGLMGHLPQEKLPGYFWDFEVKRSGSALTINQCTCIGLLPPKKKSKDSAYRGDRRPPFRKGPGFRGGGNRPMRESGIAPTGDGPRLPGPTKVAKTVDPPSESV